MRTSDEINEIAAALAKAQANIKNAPLNKSNPHFKSKYADLVSIRDATIKPLTDAGLSIVQGTSFQDGQLILTTRLLHTSGQWLESSYPVALDKPQAMGSAITYGKRYCWAAMCGIAAEEDDDGNEASQPEAKAPVKRQTAQQRQQAPAAAKPATTKPGTESPAEWVDRQINEVLPKVAAEEGANGLHNWATKFAKAQERLHSQSPALSAKLTEAYHEHWNACQPAMDDGEPHRDSAADMFP